MLAKIILLALFGSLATGSHYYEEQHSAPQPYRFGYEVKDKESTQYRHEEGDGHGSVKGSYGYTDDKGIYREVHYVADKQGFRAKINTNEPGTSNQDSASVEIQSNAKHQEHYVPVQQVHHIPVYHKEQVIPVYHKVEVAPIRPLKHFHNFNNFSPINGFNYKPFSFYNHKPISGFSGGFRNNLKGYSGSSYINNNFGFSDFDNNFGKVNSYSHSDLDKIIEDLKNKKLKNIESFSGFDNFDNINEFSDHKFDNLGHFDNLGSYNKFGGFNNLNEFRSESGFDGINKDSIEKLIEEAKQQNSHVYSGKQGDFNLNNDFHFKEYRNIGDHKYSSSSDDGFNN